MSKLCEKIIEDLNISNYDNIFIVIHADIILYNILESNLDNSVHVKSKRAIKYTVGAKTKTFELTINERSSCDFLDKSEKERVVAKIKILNQRCFNDNEVENAKRKTDLIEKILS